MRPVALYLFASLLVAGAGCTEFDRVEISNRMISTDEKEYNSILEVRIEKYKDLVKKNPKEPQYREQLARLYWALEEHEDALKQLKKAKKLDPQNPKYDYFAGKIYRELGSYRLAEASYKKLIKSVKNNAYTGPRTELAFLYLEMERYDMAEEQLRLCMESNANYALPYYFLGSLAAQRGEKDTAIDHLEKYLELGGMYYHDQAWQALQNLQPEIFDKRELYRPQQES